MTNFETYTFLTHTFALLLLGLLFQHATPCLSTQPLPYRFWRYPHEHGKSIHLLLSNVSEILLIAESYAVLRLGPESLW